MNDVTAEADPLAVPARIAFAGDWHGSGQYAQLAIEYAKRGGADVLVHTGDFGYRFARSFLSQVTAAAQAAAMPVLFVDGNHEDHRWLNRQPLDEAGLRPLTGWVFHLPRGFRWEWAGVRFLALGGAHSVDGTWRRQSGDLWQPEERITPKQADEAAAGGPADVMVTHDCPDGVNVQGLLDGVFPEHEIFRAEGHRRVLRSVVDLVRPRFLWHGHYHARYQERAWFPWGALQVTGLHCDGHPFAENIDLVDLDDLTEGIG